MEALIDEHDFYTFDDEAQASEWFQSFPIETLSESLRMDRHMPKERPSLQDMKLKKKLRSGYYQVQDKLDVAICELNMANIDYIISKIDGYIEKT